MKGVSSPGPAESMCPAYRIASMIIIWGAGRDANCYRNTTLIGSGRDCKDLVEMCLFLKGRVRLEVWLKQ
jgi:hypothetical protein